MFAIAEMITRSTILPVAAALFATGLLTGPAPAQDPLRSDDTKLEFVRPEHVDLVSLQRMVSELHGRTLAFEDGRTVKNVMVGNGALILHDRPERIREMLATIEQIDVAHEPVATDYQIEVYSPKHTDVGALCALAQRVLARRVPARLGGDTESIVLVDGQLVVRELEPHIGGVVEKLRALDEALAQGADSDPVLAIEYTPRALSPQSAIQALQPMLTGPMGQRQVQVRNLGQGGPLILQGRSKQIENAKELLEQLDRPAPQVMVSGYVLTGTNDDDAKGSNANSELTDVLQELLPYESYKIQAASVVRVAARPNSQFQLDLAGPKTGMAQARYSLQGTIAAYDSDAESLTFSSLAAMRTHQAIPGRSMFRTAATIYAGEYAVLGVAGGEPLFVVLRLKPVKAGRPKASRERKSN